MDKPKKVCLCGSSRFLPELYKAYIQETLKGNVVLTYLPSRDSHDRAAWHNTVEAKKKIDKAHLARIDISDEILILNVGGYIGKSTYREITYAHKQGKPIRYIEPIISK